ncbi:hypothetical protein ACH3XW_17870 [Acanthocheilonema viteae]|uniref:Uncharacterized protein n=1 Tax=Acanthocheilonema viteae TaxID=6277 RepID=A0A498SFB6_ACAVI|nr:unnamed protein product [Acanthocheilonema viteae]
MYLNRKSLSLCLIILSYFGLIVVGRSYETGGLMRDDYEYALEGIAVDYVTNRPRSESISRIHKNRHSQNANSNPYPFASSLSSLSSPPSSSKDSIVYHHKSSMHG